MSKGPLPARLKKLTIDDVKVTRNGDAVEIYLPFNKSDPRYPAYWKTLNYL